jgi:hypothetical protein
MSIILLYVYTIELPVYLDFKEGIVSHTVINFNLGTRQSRLAKRKLYGIPLLKMTKSLIDSLYSTVCIKKIRSTGIAFKFKSSITPYSIEFIWQAIIASNKLATRKTKDFLVMGHVRTTQWHTGCIKKTQPRNFLRNHFAILKHKRF